MEFKKKDAIYLQIADLMCERILRGTWPENERIPSVRELAVDMEVNPNTVMRTYTYLQEHAIIFNKRGIGYFVAADGRQATRRLLKCNFVRSELPRVFNTLELLDLDFDELYALYREYREANT
ncbi:MAG: GntR family transcriptional regulator [Deltaproteobacteria bacterium]|nr:GntR family transcriptional regulator [Deltaproteobacteria bacterium]